MEEEKPKERQKTDEMLMKEMIKKVDKKKLKKLIAMCFNIKDCEVLGLEQLLEEWAEQKVNLYKLFGNQLKIEKEIDISKEKLKEIQEQTGNSEEGLQNYYANEFSTFKQNIYELSPVIYNMFNNAFNWEEIKSQVPDVDRYVISAQYREGFFKRDKETMSFSTLMHKAFLSNDVDVEVSKYLQKISGNIKGKVYVSIDPFDFVTMSMNRSNWSSCHSLHSCGSNEDGVEVGCYSAGIFSYMCDNVSAIAFKTDGEEYKYEFNNRSIMAESKNWRQMIFIHPEREYFIASRQYPYKTEIIAKIIREMIEERIDNCKEVEEDKEVNDKNNKWKVSRKCYDNEKFVENSLFDKSEVSIDCQEDADCNDSDIEVLHYNDILHDFTYQFIYQSKCNKEDLPKIYIGSNPNCVICGKNELIEHDKPICEDCENKYDYDL